VGHHRAVSARAGWRDVLVQARTSAYVRSACKLPLVSEKGICMYVRMGGDVGVGVGVSVCLCLCVSVALSLSLSLSLSRYDSFPALCVCLCLSVSVSMSVSVCLSLSLSLSLLCVCVCVHAGLVSCAARGWAVQKGDESVTCAANRHCAQPQRCTA
jgi:hypothetical protein